MAYFSQHTVSDANARVPLFHIGGPLMPFALCGERNWTALLHYDHADEYARVGSQVCPECARIHQEQHIAVRAASSGRPV